MKNSIWSVPSDLSDVEQFNFVQEALVGFQSHKKYEEVRRDFLNQLPHYFKVIERNNTLSRVKYYHARLLEASEQCRS